MTQASSGGWGKRAAIIVVLLGAVAFAGWQVYRMVSPPAPGPVQGAGTAASGPAPAPGPEVDPEKRAQPGRGVALPGK